MTTINGNLCLIIVVTFTFLLCKECHLVNCAQSESIFSIGSIWRRLRDWTGLTSIGWNLHHVPYALPWHSSGSSTPLSSSSSTSYRIDGFHPANQQDSKHLENNDNDNNIFSPFGPHLPFKLKESLSSLTGLSGANLVKIIEDMKNGISSSASCMACFAATELYQSPMYSKNGLHSAIRTTCNSLRLQKPEVCNGIAQNYVEDLDYIGVHTKLTANEMCSTLLGGNCALASPSIKTNWSLHLPDKVEPIKSFSNPIKSNGPLRVTKILHITDIHADLFYSPGSDAECGRPVCCRSHETLSSPSQSFDDSLSSSSPPSILSALSSVSFPASPSPAQSASPLASVTSGSVDTIFKKRSAGYWGDYGKCDTPIATVVSALQNIASHHSDVDYWLWTGDIGPHDIWNSSRNEILNHVRYITHLIKQYSSVPVFPVIGNHEGFPANSFPPPGISGHLSASWLYEVLAIEWSTWLPETALETLRIGGYYSVPLGPGLRLVALNTNYCARLNPWTLLDPRDPGGQLKWLVNQLYEAEILGDKVQIVGHIAPDNRECTSSWVDNFIGIIDRFRETISSQFYGHTHRDEFRVYYSPINNLPIGNAYIGPSITSFKGNNPGYRIYQTTSQGMVINHDTYFFNLTQANLNGHYGPIWRLGYNALIDLKLPSLDPINWNLFIRRLLTNEQEFQRFYKLFSRFSDASMYKPCTLSCKQEIIDELQVYVSWRKLPKAFRKNHS
ncbi:sphingomyelin phosphodiesterase-like [Tetranychus urticae]|uniref:sphingomyelin phosphodiesterase-like n=1 Tax=Tetranychus urticae TaxID=32264 RepID=UPI000D64185C|nr:sphingomyelin phosphodiesterase-like [Tetranychus urticae]XP_025016769.1 sphingomyelin phosphodiesterase-like [Tetranychus urticae]